jgi:hypothetical protein
MRFQTFSIIALIISLFLAGCGGSGKSDYDGNWTASYTDPASVPVVNNSSQYITQTVSCASPTTTITLVNGSGSTKQTQTCVITTTDSFTTPATTTTATQTTDFLISAAINGSTSVMNAVVNGTPLSGTCISTVGCSAQATTGTGALSLTR